MDPLDNSRSSKPIYLDYAATTPVDPRVVEQNVQPFCRDTSLCSAPQVSIAGSNELHERHGVGSPERIPYMWQDHEGLVLGPGVGRSAKSGWRNESRHPD